LRREISPVTAAQFMSFLTRWQHHATGTALHGVDGTFTVISQLQGYEISAAFWESKILSARVARYESEMLDRLCFSGEVMWGRLSPHRAPSEVDDAKARRLRVRPSRLSPVSLFLREDADWLLAMADSPQRVQRALSHAAGEVLSVLDEQGACFFGDLKRGTGRLSSEVEDALWELLAAGLVTADGFENLRSLVDPKRRRGEGRGRLGRPRHASGRWALLRRTSEDEASESMDERLSKLERFAEQLLRRWGVVFRDLLAREVLAPPWRDLLMVYRRMEARGVIRGGRFVAGFLGEQFALPEAVDLLRSVRRAGPSGETVEVSAADPLNLVGIILPGPRLSSLSGGRLLLRDGVPVDSSESLDAYASFMA
jgi:ATP-dependent Lhr-like helicase